MALQSPDGIDESKAAAGSASTFIELNEAHKISSGCAVT